MKVLILGGDGFIGSYLRKKHLELKDDVIILDKDCIRSENSFDYDFIQSYIEDSEYSIFKDIIKYHRPDFVYNCIAIANPHYYTIEPINTFQIDFKINYDIIQILNENKIPFIHFSTCEVYGKEPKQPYSEDISNSVFGPANKIRWIYATSKLLLDQLLYADKGNHVTIRPFNFIEHDIDWLPDLNNTDKFWKPRLPSCFLNNLLTNQPLYIVSPGIQKRCYTHIDDAIDAIISIMNNWDKCKGEIINIGNPQNEISVIGAAKLMAELYQQFSNSDHIVTFKSVSGDEYYGNGYEDCFKRIPDISKIQRLTDWIPKINLYDTFSRTVQNGIKSYSYLLK